MTQAQHSQGGQADLATLRKRAVLTQVELAEKAELTERTIVEIEGGKVDSPRPTTIRAIAAVLRLEPEQVAAAIEESRRQAAEALHG